MTTTTPVTIAVLGTGDVGSALATGWARAGHHVILGSRRPDSERIRRAVADIGAREAADHADAARRADVTVVAVPGDQVDSLITGLGDALRGRTAIDATNSMSPGADTLHHVDALTTAGATTYRAFNTTGWEQMAQPRFGPQCADMPYSGPDGSERHVVDRLVDDLGFRAIWLGDGPDAHALTDALARLWFQLAFRQGWGRRLAWKMLTEADD